MLGLGRAVGEAIAVTQVIGEHARGSTSRSSRTGTRSRAASPSQYQGAPDKLHIASLVYLGLVLLVFSLATKSLRS